MKNLREPLLLLLQKSCCTPQISVLAKKLKQPSATIHYNIKKLEQEGVIKAYKAVLDYGKAGQGFCSFVLLSLSPDEYGDPEQVARELAKHDEIESVDICTGEWELVLKVRVKDMDDYYRLVKTVLSRTGITKIKSLGSMKQVKSEYVQLPKL